MKNNIIISLILVALVSTSMCLLSGCSKDDKYIPAITNKEERQLIKDGNKLFDKGKYQEAEIMYNKATQVNPNSPAANYNLALSLVKQLKSTDNDSIKNDMMAHALSLFELVPTLTKDSTLIAMAYHNMGNLRYENEA
ncbi:MAG: tetratricopeptide repeat protein, partial [Muribaculaceae bacterium]|nr:tetratricopeptide repeat protein [Muribaculaceae bacterium]